VVTVSISAGFSLVEGRDVRYDEARLGQRLLEAADQLGQCRVGTEIGDRDQ
jgi:hypothetical protein